jgi:hypothetical protein
MNLTRTLIGTLALVTSALAFAAGSYDAESRKVDSAIAASKMTPSTTDQARKLRADSERMMKEGKEAEAMKLLEDVKKLLGMK